MILRLLRVEGWRCFANAVQVGPLGDGLNVVFGPNGIGKSTLLLALCRGLFDNHTVSGRAVEVLRPWGRDLKPTVDIEFEHDGERMRLLKRFLGSPCAELSRFERGQFVRLAEGEGACRQVRAMLGAAAPSRGPSDAQHWGLAQVLWAPQQSGMAIAELSAGTAGAIQAALGAQVAGTSGESLEKKIAEAYGRIYTTSGNLRRGKDAPPVVALEQKLAEAQAQQQNLVERLEAFEQGSRRIEDLRSRGHHASRDQQQRERALDQARRRAQAYRDMTAARDTQQQAVGGAEARYHELRLRIDSIKGAREELAHAQKELDQLGSDAPHQAKEVEQRRLEAERARGELDRIRMRRAEVDAAEALAQRASRFVAERRQLADTEQLLSKIAAARQEWESLKTRRSEWLAPDAATLQAIQEAVKRRDNAQLKLEASLITLSIVPEADLSLEILSAEQTGEQKVTAEKPCQIQGSPEVVFRVPGLAMFRATGPTGSVEPLRKEIAEASRRIDALSEGFGSTDLDHLRQIQARAAALDSEVAQAAAVLKTLLGSRRFEEIQQERVRSAQVVDQILAQQPLWDSQPPDADMLGAAATETKNRFIADVERAEEGWKRAENALSLAKEKLSQHTARSESARERAAGIRHRLEQLDGDGRDEARRQAELGQLALQWDAAQARLAQIREQMADFVDDPQQEVELLERQLKQLQQQARQAEAELHNEQGRLEQLASQAPYSALAEVEEAIGRLEEEIAAERLRNQAIRLLFATVTQYKRAAIEAVVGPVEQRATRTLQRIAGTRLGRVQFSERFLPRAVAPKSAGDSIAIDQLSGGEMEQVYFAVRLALAEVLFADRRQLVVLDDVLTSTDTARLARMLGILAEAAEKFQVLILTCHPERYQGVPEACFFDLEALAARATE